MDDVRSNRLSISEVTRITGLSAATLRLWERYELVSPERGDNNYRIYSSADLQRIRDIVRLRQTEEMPLSAIRGILDQSSTGTAVSATSGKTSSSTVGRHTSTARKRMLGPKLKSLRRAKGMSIRGVAAQTGLTPSHISMLETTSTGASYATLSKLAECYGTTLHELNRIEKDPSDIQVVRGQGRILPQYRQGLQIEQMAEGVLKMDVTRVQLDVGCSSGDEPYSHNGEEYVYVLSGQFEIAFDNVTVYLLEQNESIYFDSRRPHSWRNPGLTTTDVLWVNTVPSF